MKHIVRILGMVFFITAFLGCANKSSDAQKIAQQQTDEIRLTPEHQAELDKIGRWEDSVRWHPIPLLPEENRRKEMWERINHTSYFGPYTKE